MYYSLKGYVISENKTIDINYENVFFEDNISDSNVANIFRETFDYADLICLRLINLVSDKVLNICNNRVLIK